MPALTVLTYDPRLPSFTYRIAPLLAALEQRGWRCTVDVLPQRRYGVRIWERRAHIRGASAVLLHKLRLAPWEMAWVARLNARTLFDIDDVTWLSQSRSVDRPPIESASRRAAFAAIARRAALTLAGNTYLAEHARAHGARIEIVPTAVDTADVAAVDFARRAGTTAVWIGLRGNLQYLEPLRPALARVARRHPGFRLRVISSSGLDWNDVPVEFVPWAPGIEATEALTGADIGLMPLPDDAFTRGKCAFKLLQYMAASLPCVASPVGANREVVVDGQTGRWAATAAEWQQALEELLGDHGRRDAFGAAGRRRVEQCYDRRVVIPRAADLVEGIARRATLTS
jgi:glycosyltransferase involved in cell wall biosynthesis